MTKLQKKLTKQQEKKLLEYYESELDQMVYETMRDYASLDISADANENAAIYAKEQFKEECGNAVKKLEKKGIDVWLRYDVVFEVRIDYVEEKIKGEIT